LSKSDIKFTITPENALPVVDNMLDTLQRGLKAGPVLVTLGRPTRNNEQNAKVHAMFSDISKQVKWHGQKFTGEVWKRLCVASYLRERNESPMLVPSLDGRGVDIIYQKTSKMSKKVMAELIEWVACFGAESGVVWSERAKEMFDNV